MTTSTIIYAGAILEVPDFLVDLWPHELPLSDWPTYCGAGDGLGDRIVPDSIWGARVCPACFIHDIDWAIADGSYRAFQAANNRFKRNLVALTDAQLYSQVRIAAKIRCNTYWLVVSSPVGWRNYEPSGSDPYTNPVVKDKLFRLARAKLRID